MNLKGGIAKQQRRYLPHCHINSLWEVPRPWIYNYLQKFM